MNRNKHNFNFDVQNEDSGLHGDLNLGFGGVKEVGITVAVAGATALVVAAGKIVGEALGNIWARMLEDRYPPNPKL